jgi:hypothetical protein
MELLLLQHLFVNCSIHKGISILPAVASTSSSWQVGNGQYFDWLSEAIITNITWPKIVRFSNFLGPDPSAYSGLTIYAHRSVLKLK